MLDDVHKLVVNFVVWCRDGSLLTTNEKILLKCSSWQLFPQAAHIHTAAIFLWPCAQGEKLRSHTALFAGAINVVICIILPPPNWSGTEKTTYTKKYHHTIGKPYSIKKYQHISWTQLFKPGGESTGCNQTAMLARQCPMYLQIFTIHLFS